MLKILAATSSGSPELADLRRQFIFTGFPGRFTSFSDFTRETTGIFKLGKWCSALRYPVIGNVTVQSTARSGYRFGKHRQLPA
jgi:fluoride ion exporter CrcB/FEX